MYRDSNLRSFLKAFSWRFFGTLITACVVYFFTRRFDFAALAGGFDATAKIILYYAHEKIWERFNFGKEQQEAFVLWFTGLSGSGKSSLASEAVKILKRRGLKVEWLDGESIQTLFPETGFSRSERTVHLKRMAFLASVLERNGVTVVCSFISPYRDVRDFGRSICKNFIEAYVSTPLEACEKRDRSGLYKKARAGAITDLSGLNSKYEEPLSPELRFDFSKLELKDALTELESYLVRSKALRMPKLLKTGKLRTEEGVMPIGADELRRISANE